MMSTTAPNLSLVQGGGALPTLNLTNEEKIVAIRNTVAKGASDPEFQMFMHLANRYQMDPFLKEIWFIKYGDKNPTIMVSRDGLRNYAMRQPDWIGMMSQEVRQGDTFKYNPISGEIFHEVGDGTGLITKCYCIIQRESKKDHIEIIDFKEYYDALCGKNPVWKSHPSAMGKKMVEVLALKKCYTITGLYAPEEMGMQEPIDITPPEASPSNAQREMHGNTQDAQEERLLRARKALFASATEKGVSEGDLKETMFALYGKSSTKELTMDEISHLINHIKTLEHKSTNGEPPIDVNDQPELDLKEDELGF